MSALCAYPSLIPSGGFAGLPHASSVVALAGSYSIPTNVDSSRHHGYSINGRSQFTAYTAYTAASVNNLAAVKSDKLFADSQASGLWTPEPAAKRRCTDKSRSTAGWSTDSGSSVAIWSQQQQSRSSVCPSGCSMCHQQQQHHQQHFQQQQHYQSQMESANRRPLQERHQNRLMAEESLLAAASVAPGSTNLATPAPPIKSTAMLPSPMLLSRSSRSTTSQSSRQLCVDPKKDYSSPLHVDCSVEYDLPRVVRPPPGAQPLLMLAPRRQQPSSSVAGHHASHGNQVGRTDVMYHPHHPTLMAANNQAVWNSGNAASLATALVGDWTTPKQPKLINKSTATNSSSNIIKNASAAVASRPMVAAPAPNLMGGNVGGAMLQRNTAVAGQCGCPSCLGRHSVFSGAPSAAAVRVQSAWNHWSPPIGATAASVYQQQQQQQQQHQRAVASFQLPGVTYVDQQSQQQQVNPRRRKRTDDSADKSSMSGLYATSAAWMNAQTAAAVAADAAFAAANRYAAAAPWMTNPAPHLKFPC